jgi:hypothetical protein
MQLPPNGSSEVFIGKAAPFPRKNSSFSTD